MELVLGIHQSGGERDSPQALIPRPNKSDAVSAARGAFTLPSMHRMTSPVEPFEMRRQERVYGELTAHVESMKNNRDLPSVRWHFRGPTGESLRRGGRLEAAALAHAVDAHPVFQRPNL